MLALRSAPPRFVIAEAERIAREVYGLTALPRPLSGERDCNVHLTADSREATNDAAPLTDQALEFRDDLEQIADEPDIRHFENRRFAVLVDGDDGPGVLDAGQMLNGT